MGETFWVVVVQLRFRGWDRMRSYGFEVVGKLGTIHVIVNDDG